MSVKIKGKLPKAPNDGLQHLTDRLRRHTDEAIVAIVVLAPDAVTEQLHDDEDPYVVALKVLQIEPLDASTALDARELLEKVFEGRTGLKALPFDQLLGE